MKKTSLIILIALSGVFFSYAQSCPSQASAGEKVCSNDSDCLSGEACFAKYRCYNSVRICGVEVKTPIEPVIVQTPEEKCRAQGANYDPYTGACYANEEERCERVLRGTYKDGKCVNSSDIPVGNSSTFTPGAAGARGSVPSFTEGPLIDFLKMAQDIVTRLVPILITVALLAFFFFLIRFIWKGADNPTERDKMKSGMAWSILALFVMVSIWGIIGVMGKILGTPPGGSMQGFKLPGQK